jgi:type I restriction-modification system DNA methylase subunit
VLFQNGQERLRADLADREQLARLLNQYFEFTLPDFERFDQAVDEFKERVPDLAQGLVEKIQAAHKSNTKFQAAFDHFFSLCQTALNPNISRAAVDEMLVQHLLTERPIRKIFDNPEFMRRNVIALEVEKVIAALVSKSFNRDDFLKSLDLFYRAIEDAARGLEDFAEKQHFLNTVYERFFQGYSVKVADTHGIVYTPQEIVDFMCASVAEVLETEFGKSLGDKDVHNIEHAYFELTGSYEPFEGLCFCRHLGYGGGTAKPVRLHDRSQYGACGTAEEGADYGRHRQPAVQRRAGQ